VTDRHDTRTAVTGRPGWLLVGAAAVLVSGYVHYRLYFLGGYRGIAPEQFAGLTISRAFAVNAIVGFVLAWALVVSVRVPRLAAPAALGGALFAAGTLGAYFLSRTVGLLGFDEHTTTTEGVIAAVAEVVAIAALGGWLLFGLVPTAVRTPSATAMSGT
jgi:hypothetical protein